MIVVMSWGQFVSVKHWASNRHLQYLDVAERVNQRRVVSMPYSGWVALSEALLDQSFTKWGKGRPGKLTGAATKTRSALTNINRRLVTLSCHPALAGEAVIGYSEELLEVWWAPREARWSLTPVTNQEMQVLVPVSDDSLVVSSVEATGVKTSFHLWEGLTRWMARGWDESFRERGLFPAEEHLGWTTSR